MGISMLPGWYDQIAPYVQQLSGIVPRLINPHLDAQRALQSRILENPQILQQFADIQANNPGAIDKLGFGNISGYFNQFGESQESKAKKEKDKAIASLTPEQQRERAANLAGVMSPQEMQLYGLNIKNLQKGIEERDQNLSEGEAKRKEFERIQGLEKNFSEWSKGQGKFNLYAKRRSGDVPEWMADAITSSSKISKQYDQDAQDYFRENELNLSRQRLQLQKNNDRQTYEEWKRKSIQDQAERMAYRAGSTNIQGFVDLIQNPQLQIQLEKSTPEALKMLSGPNSQLSAAVDAFNSQNQVGEKAKQGIYDDLRVAHQQAKIAADRLRNGLGTELEVQTAVDSYNARLAGARGTGIKAGMLQFGVDPNARVNKTNLIPGDSPDTRPRLMLVDPENGNILKGEGFEVPDPTNSPDFAKQIDGAFRDLVAKSPAERKQVLEQLRSRQDPASQTAYKQILEKLKRSGINTGGVQ